MPVEWTRLNGDLIEEIVAVLLCRRFPAATLVRPSRGDGGIDVLVPVSDDSGVEVYQVKKFSANLTASQKGQIARSFNRLEENRREESLDVRAWHLTLPLNPTRENLKWLAKTTQCAPYGCDWRGLNFIDGLAAEFPNVIDYYLHDGADRLARVVAQMTALLQMKQHTPGAGLITPTQVAEQLHAVQPLLDTDPHFIYAISLDPSMPSLTHPDPGLIVAVSSGSREPGSGVVTVKVYPRFAAALEVRPIPVNVTFHAELGTPFAEELDAFRKFGTPLQTPPGSVTVNADLPGGLGGVYDGATARVDPSLQAGGARSHQLRLAALGRDDTSVAEVVLDMQPASTGPDKTGLRTHGTDRGRLIDFEFLTDFEYKRSTFKLTLRDIAGRHPAELISAVRFLLALRPPNTLAVAKPFGPITHKLTDASSLDGWLDFDALEQLLIAFESLVAVQAHTEAQLALPSLEAIDSTTISTWVSARRLLDGEALMLPGTDIGVCLIPGVEFPGEQFAFASTADFAIQVGEQVVPLGQQILHCPMFELVPGSLRSHGDHQDVRMRPVDGTPVTVRLARND